MEVRRHACLPPAEIDGGRRAACRAGASKAGRRPNIWGTVRLRSGQAARAPPEIRCTLENGHRVDQPVHGRKAQGVLPF